MVRQFSSSKMIMNLISFAGGVVKEAYDVMEAGNGKVALEKLKAGVISGSNFIRSKYASDEWL